MKRGYEFSFSWLFTLIVGAVILFLAVYIAIQLTNLRQFQRESEEAKDIGVLLTPVETGLESGKFATLYVPDETKIFNDCEPLTPPIAQSDPFGSQELSLSIKPSFGGEFQVVTGVESTFHNKYIFSNKTVHGDEEFYVLSKPISLPFKIADILMLWSDKEIYCFDLTGAPPSFSNELRYLNMTNVFLNAASCPNVPGKKDVCFHSGCEISITLLGTGNGGTVRKNGETLQFILLQSDEEYSFLYAAIFSDPEIYNCHLRRLAAHAVYLSEIYNKKTDYIVSDLCGGSGYNNFKSALGDYILTAQQLSNEPNPSNTLNELNQKANQLNNENPQSCKIF